MADRKVIELYYCPKHGEYYSQNCSNCMADDVEAAAVKARDEESIQLLCAWKALANNTDRPKNERFAMLADLVNQRIKYLEARISEVKYD